MAECLVKAIDASIPDPGIDAKSSFKAGDIVAVRDDGHVWGSAEGPPMFRVVKFSGTPAEELAHLVQPQLVPLANLIAPTVRKIPRLFRLARRTLPRPTARPRRFRIDSGDLIQDKG